VRRPNKGKEEIDEGGKSREAMIRRLFGREEKSPQKDGGASGGREGLAEAQKGRTIQIKKKGVVKKVVVTSAWGSTWGSAKAVPA